MSSTLPEFLAFTFFGIEVEVRVADRKCSELLLATYGCFQSPAMGPALTYLVRRVEDGGFVIRRGATRLLASDDGDFLYLFEKDLTIEVQKLRHELYFVHAAALAYKGKGLMLVASSGGGKSTTTWALTHHGFLYLSDELAPIELQAHNILPYPRALSLKNPPPESYPLPQRVLRTARTLHVPSDALPAGIQRTPVSLAAAFFLSYSPEAASPQVRPMGQAEAAARLFASALNALAHPGEGLDGALDIATRCTCFELVANDLARTCSAVTETMEGVINRREASL